MRIRIAALAHNRKAITAFALDTLRAAKAIDDDLIIYNDGSTEYDANWLALWGPAIDGPNIGTEAQRRRHILDFMDSDADLLYFTDNDTIHDPSAFDRGRDLIRQYPDRLVCLYNTDAHARLAGNTLGEDMEAGVIWRVYAPGVSYLMTRSTVEKLLPFVPAMKAFDWEIPTIIGKPCVISKVSYLDHIGAGGLRHPADAGLDGGDRCLNPTNWLVRKRVEVVAKLSAP